MTKNCIWFISITVLLGQPFSSVATQRSAISLETWHVGAIRTSGAITISCWSVLGQNDLATGNTACVQPEVSAPITRLTNEQSENAPTELDAELKPNERSKHQVGVFHVVSLEMTSSGSSATRVLEQNDTVLPYGALIPGGGLVGVVFIVWCFVIYYRYKKTTQYKQLPSDDQTVWRSRCEQSEMQVWY